MVMATATVTATTERKKGRFQTKAALLHELTERQMPRALLADARHSADDRVEAGIDVHDFRAHAARQFRQQERGDVAHLLDRHVALERRVVFDELEDLAEALDAACRERLDRAG